MLPPVQNQDTTQRSGALSEVRAAEQGRVFANIERSTMEMQRSEELKNTTVQKDDDSEGVNPDGSGGGQQQGKKKKGEEETQPETNTPAGHPLKLEGGDVIDLMA